LKCTRNVTLPGSGLLDVTTGYKAELLEGYNIKPFEGCQSPMEISQKNQEQNQEGLEI
jgi:hypothetical protein